MPWMETCAVDQRTRFVLEVERGEFSVSELCGSFGISRKTAYKWLHRYQAEGLDGLRDRSRARRVQPHAVPDAVRRRIIEARRRHPTWGPKKLRPWLARQDPDLPLPSLTTMHTILDDAGLIRRQRRRRHPVVGVQGTLSGDDRPNGVWCVDFKGQFRLGNGRLCFPLTVTDSHSRMLLLCRGHRGTHREPVQAALTDLFERVGVPQAIRSDNGLPFAASGLARLSRLSVWWMDQGISLQRITPGRPQQNGRHERMHRTLKAETTRPPKHSMGRQQRCFDAFVQTYNWERPHEALDDRCPGDVYEPPVRAYTPGGLPLVYPGHYETRMVTTAGQITWRKRRVFLSESLAGRRVGLVEIEEARWRLYYREQAIGLLDEQGTQPTVRPIPGPDGGDN